MSCHRAHMAEHLGGALAFDIQRRVANEMSWQNESFQDKKCLGVKH